MELIPATEILQGEKFGGSRFPFICMGEVMHNLDSNSTPRKQLLDACTDNSETIIGCTKALLDESSRL